MNAKNNRWRSQKMNSSRELITTPNRIRIMRNIAGLILGLIWLCTTLYQFTSTAPTPTSLTQNSIEIVQKEKDAPPHTSNWFATNFTFPTVEERVEREGSKCKKAALILFGVPSHFQYIWKSYMKYIVQRNPQLHFEVYMHMYSDLHQQPFSSSRNAVRNAKLESPDDVWEILRKGSVLAGITTSSQSTFDESELSWLQQSDTIGFWDYPFQTLQNMFRQGNSLRESLLYLQDQKKHSNDIDVYIFARSDTMLLTPIDIPCSGIGGNEIWVPSWGSWRGINDRFAIAGPNAAKVYASRIEGYKEAMLARRSNPKALPPFNNSEMLHKNWLLKNLLNVTQMGDEWAKLSRVRADGRMHHSDHPSHIATLLNGTVRLDANGNLINVHIAAVAEK